MKLYYSLASPYSRKVLMLARSLGMGNDVEVIMANPLDNGAELLKVNPLNKVPALIQGGKTYFDSPVIVEHLLVLAGQESVGEHFLKRLEVQALADGIMDAAVAIRMESVRPDAEQSEMWKGRWHLAIERGLKMVEETVIDGLAGWKIDSITVACMLDYLNFRLPDIDWRAACPKAAAWFAEAEKRNDMIVTDPRKG